MPQFVALQPPMRLTVQPFNGEACLHEFPGASPVTIPADHVLCLKMARRNTHLQEQ